MLPEARRDTTTLEHEHNESTHGLSLRSEKKEKKKFVGPLYYYTLTMTCANVMSRFGSPMSVRSVDVAVGFRCRGSAHISHHLLGHASPAKPLRPCISPEPLLELRPAGFLRREKRVAFADAKGLALITVRLFSERDDKLPHEPVKTPRLKRLSCAREPGNKTSRLRLGFWQPCGDFQAFRERLRDHMVLLESCDVSNHSILGTVRVRNVCFEKAVNVRITFDTWRSYLDVPCTYLHQSYGEPGTDVFEFSISAPDRPDPHKTIEFCVSYQPASFTEPVWDNNGGKNYCIHVCDG